MVGGGEGVFFRKQIGLETFIETKDTKTKEVVERKLDFMHRTRLSLELEICSTYLGGMLHMDFRILPREEKLKWYLHYEMETKRDTLFKKMEMEEIDKARTK